MGNMGLMSSRFVNNHNSSSMVNLDKPRVKKSKEVSKSFADFRLKGASLNPNAHLQENTNDNGEGSIASEISGDEWGEIVKYE